MIVNRRCGFKYLLSSVVVGGGRVDVVGGRVVVMFLQYRTEIFKDKLDL